MDTPGILCDDARALGRSLRRWRALQRIKQAHAGELLGVSQATISRWESGQQAPDADEQRRLRTLMQARLASAADHELARLVNQSAAAVHLVCDSTHRLLALSALRERQCSLPRSALLGQSLWRYASAEIVAAEARLGALGWFEPDAPALEILTGANRHTEVAIEPSRCRWVRFQLADGSHVRLVETLAPWAGPPAHAQPSSQGASSPSVSS